MKTQMDKASEASLYTDTEYCLRSLREGDILLWREICCMLPALGFDLDTGIVCAIKGKEWHWNLEAILPL